MSLPCGIIRPAHSRPIRSDECHYHAALFAPHTQDLYAVGAKISGVYPQQAARIAVAEFSSPPVADVAKTPTGVSNPKIMHPPAQNRVNQGHHPVYRLCAAPSKDVFEFSEQGGAGLQPWGEANAPLAPEGCPAPPVNPQKTNGLSGPQVHEAGGLRIHLPIQGRAVFTESGGRRVNQPGPRLTSLPQDAQVIRKSRILDGGGLPRACDLPGPLPPLVALLERASAAPRRNHPPRRNAPRAPRVPDAFQQAPPLRRIDPFGPVLSHPGRASRGKGGFQIPRHDARLVMDDGLCHALYSGRGRPLGTIPSRPRVNVRFTERFTQEFQGPRHPTVSDGRNAQDAPRAGVVGNRLPSMA